MIDFSNLFAEAKGEAIHYKGKILVMGDDLAFEDGDKILVTFEQTNSNWTQGIGLYMFGFFEIDGKKYKDRIVLWETTSPKETIITLFKEKSGRYHPKGLPKKGLLGIKNIWDTGDGVIESWHGAAAMIVEEIENGKRYRCNDGYPDENFDDIVFTITKISA